MSRSGELRSDVIYFVMEHANRGELFKYICETRRFSEKLARTLFIQILEAAEYCHSLGIAHRDLKAENVLLDKNFNVKLADLGSAIDDSEPANLMYFGSDEYNPPEVLKHFD
jgi:serine/threonine protein kinase